MLYLMTTVSCSATQVTWVRLKGKVTTGVAWSLVNNRVSPKRSFCLIKMYGCVNRDKVMIKFRHWSILVNYSESELKPDSNSKSINPDIFFFFSLYWHSSEQTCRYFFLTFQLEKSISSGKVHFNWKSIFELETTISTVKAHFNWKNRLELEKSILTRTVHLNYTISK